MKLKILGQQEFCLLNNIQHMIVTEYEIFNMNKLDFIFDMAYRGELYVERTISQTIRTSKEFIDSVWSEGTR